MKRAKRPTIVGLRVIQKSAGVRAAENSEGTKDNTGSTTIVQRNRT